MPRYTQLCVEGRGRSSAKGIAATVVAKLMIVTNHNRSTPLRNAAFHVACNTAAKSVRPMTAGLIFRGGSNRPRAHTTFARISNHCSVAAEGRQMSLQYRRAVSVKI